MKNNNKSPKHSDQFIKQLISNINLNLKLKETPKKNNIIDIKPQESCVFVLN